MYRAPFPVSPREAAEIMEAALAYADGGYNAFEPKLLLKLPADAQVILAREYSVCVYVTVNPLFAGKDALQRKMEADECDFQEDGTLRLWWD